MIKEVFRQTALEQMTSPDRQDEILTVTTPGDWIGLAAIALLVGGVFGETPTVDQEQKAKAYDQQECVSRSESNNRPST